MKLFELFDNPGEAKEAPFSTYGGPNDKDFFFIINKETGKVLPGTIGENNKKIKAADQWIQYGIYVDEISRDSDRKYLPGIKPVSNWSRDDDQTFARWKFPEGTYTISFGAAEGGGEEKDTLTGTGHAIKVLSVVVSIMRRTIADPKVKHFLALASLKEPSRVKLYGKLMKTLGVKKEWDYGGYRYWIT